MITIIIIIDFYIITIIITIIIIIIIIIIIARTDVYRNSSRVNKGKKPMDKKKR